MSTPDCGLGRYEDAALRLEPAARVVVERPAGLNPSAGAPTRDELRARARSYPREP